MTETAEDRLEADIWGALHKSGTHLDPVRAAALVESLMFAAQRYAAADNTIVTEVRRKALEDAL